MCLLRSFQLDKAFVDLINFMSPKNKFEYFVFNFYISALKRYMYKDKYHVDLYELKLNNNDKQFQTILLNYNTCGCMFLNKACASIFDGIHLVKTHFPSIYSLFLGVNKKISGNPTNLEITHEQLDVSANNMNKLEQNKSQSVVYLLKLLSYQKPRQKYKFGITTDIKNRYKAHKKTFGNVEIIKIFNMKDSNQRDVKEVEDGIKIFCKEINIYSPFIPNNSKKKQTEIFELDEKCDNDIIINSLINHVNSIIKTQKKKTLSQIGDNINVLPKQAHEYRMALIEVERKRLELEILKIEKGIK